MISALPRRREAVNQGSETLVARMVKSANRAASTFKLVVKQTSANGHITMRQVAINTVALYVLSYIQKAVPVKSSVSTTPAANPPNAKVSMAKAIGPAWIGKLQEVGDADLKRAEALSKVQALERSSQHMIRVKWWSEVCQSQLLRNLV